MCNHWEWGVAISKRVNWFRPRFTKKLIRRLVTVLTKPGLVGPGIGPHLVGLHLLMVDNFYKSLSRRLFSWKWFVQKCFFSVNYLRRYLSFQDSHPWKGGRKRKKKTLSSFIILLKAECNEDYNVYTMMCSLVCFISDRNTRKTKLQRTCQDVWCLDKYQRRCVEEGKRIASKGLE